MDSLFASLRRQAYSADADDALLARFAAGDEGAFAELVRRHGPVVYAAARRRLPDPADAADVFQATFVLLVRKASRLAGRPTVGPWLYRTAALTARNLRRRNARRPVRLEAEVMPRHDPDPATRWDLDDALLALPERDRAAVVLCHLLGHSRQEAAHQLGLPEGTLSTVLHRALRKLRVRLGCDPRPALAVGGMAVPAGLATATVRTATAVWAAGLPAATPGVVALASSGGWLGWKPLAAAGLVAAAGLGVGLSQRPASVPPAAVSPAPSRVGIHLTADGITWTEAGDWRPDLRLPVRTADDLRPLLDRFRREAGADGRVALTADAAIAPDTLLAVARACVAGGFPGVQYAGPTPGFSGSFGTESHDWGRGQVVELPTPVDLTTAFGLHLRSDTVEARVTALVGKLKGVVTRDDARPGRPVVGVSLAGTPTTDADTTELAALPALTTLSLRQTRLTDAGVKAVAGCGQLAVLDLGRTAVGDAGLADLAPLAGLSVLRLDGTRITDAGLPALARLQGLTALDLADTAVTPAGVELLRRALPGCHVQR